MSDELIVPGQVNALVGVISVLVGYYCLAMSSQVRHDISAISGRGPKLDKFTIMQKIEQPNHYHS